MTMRVAVALWVVVVLGISIRFMVVGDSHNTVFPVFQGAAEKWAAGADTYVPHERYRYPPIATVFFAALISIGETAGSLLWRWINIAAYLGAVWWAFRAGFPIRLSRRAQGATLLLMIVPSLSSLANGQSNGLLLAGILAAAIAVAQNRQRLAAACISVPIAFKLFPVTFAMLVGVLRPRRFVTTLVAVLTVLAAVPFLFQSVEYVAGQYGALVDLLRAEDRTRDLNDAYRDLRLLLAHLGTPIEEGTYTILQVVTGAGIAALCVVGRRTGWSWNATMGYAHALTLCWMLVFGFSAEKATYLVSTPLLCWLIAHARSRRDWFVFAGLLLLYVLYLVPIFALNEARRGPIARSALPAATLVMMAGIVVHGAGAVRRGGVIRS